MALRTADATLRAGGCYEIPRVGFAYVSVRITMAEGNVPCEIVADDPVVSQNKSEGTDVILILPEHRP